MVNFPEVDVDLIGFIHIQDQSMHHPTSCFHSKGERVVVFVAANHCCVICKLHILVGIPETRVMPQQKGQNTAGSVLKVFC